MITFEDDAERLHNLLAFGGHIVRLSLIYPAILNRDSTAAVELELKIDFGPGRIPQDRIVKIKANNVVEFKSSENSEPYITPEITDIRSHQIEGASFSFGTGHGPELSFLCSDFKVEIINLYPDT